MRFHRVVMSCLLVVTLIFSTSACTPKESMQQINWNNMRGAWMSEDGEMLGKIALTICGSLPVEYDGTNSKKAELNFIWPEEFKHMNYGAETLSVFSNSKENATESFPFYVFGYTSYYEPTVDKPVPLTFVIFPDDGFAVFIKADNSQYFVASTDHNANLDGLLEEYLALGIT